ncbi:MAG: hypothetical protein NTZ26_01995 [Candidatus Aminicenantes bacterium]|nr:hypothetical protein [Candidatus Aminicenantes bacterium]
MKKEKPIRNGACAFIRSHLISVVGGEAPGAAFSRIKDHLDACPECASIVRRFSEAWKDPVCPPEAWPSPAFLPGLIERIEAGEVSRLGRPGVFAIARRVLRPAAVAAIFLAGIFAGHEMGRGNNTSPPPEASYAEGLFDSFQSIPSGSVAGFYVNLQKSTKEDPK